MNKPIRAILVQMKRLIKTIFLFLNLSLLSGCYTHEYYGHYKFKEEDVIKGLTKQQIIDQLGSPLNLINDDVFYYMYSKVKKSAFGSSKEQEAKIMRLEFENNRLIKCAVFDYKDYIAHENRTAQPDMNINIFSEILEGIGEISDVETMKGKAQGKEPDTSFKPN